MRKPVAGITLVRAVLRSVLPLLLLSATTAPSGELVLSAQTGTRMSREEARQLEQALRDAGAAPDGAAQQRAKLLGLYSLRPAEDAARRLPLVLWMIQNRPTDAFAGSAFCRIDPEVDGAGY